jgi:cysteine-rich repeat protein
MVLGAAITHVITMRCFFVLAALLATGCLGSGVVECPGGGVCPPGLVCRVDRGAQICAVASCGNGVTESGESCDDGNNDSDDLCPGDCVTRPICGNGEREVGEECDDGNVVSGDGCQASCLFPVRPAPRTGSATAYDAARGMLVLFGGNAETETFDDTWEWNRTEWVKRSPAAPRPEARTRAAMTYDPVRQRVLMYGGTGSTGQPLSDTWEWDGETWRALTTTEHPPQTESLTFDTRRGLAVLVGGQPTEHWEWNGVSWILRQPPPFMVFPGMGGALAYDETLDLTLCLPGGPDAWSYNGTAWAAGPGMPAPMLAQLAYDAARGRLELVTEQDLRTWELVDGTWVERTTDVRPPVRQSFELVAAAPLGVVLFGGVDGSAWFDDLWLWDGTTWRELL